MIAEYDNSLCGKNFFRVYILYTVLFVAIFVAGWQAIWLNGKTLLRAADGLNTHVVLLNYMGRYLRGIIRSILALTPEIPTFDFSIGLGEDVITVLSPGSPFDLLNLLTVFVPSKHTEALYNFIVVARLYLPGISFIHFCLYMKAKPYHTVIGALTYVFSGWAIEFVMAHPYFLIPMFYMPLIVEGLDKILTVTGKPYLFIVSVFLSATTGFYFLYMELLFLAIYVLIRVHHLYGRDYIRKLVSLAGQAVGYCAIGLMMAAVLLLPSIIGYLNCSRAGHLNLESLWHFPSAYEYVDFVVKFIAGSSSLDFLGVTAISAIAVVWLVCENSRSDFQGRNNKRHLVLFLVVLLLIRLVPAGGYVMNGFGYVTQRWMFLFVFLNAFILAYKLPGIFNLRGTRLLITIGIATGYGLVVIFNKRYTSLYYMMGFAMLVLTIAVLSFEEKGVDIENKSKPKYYIKEIALVLIIAINAAANAHLSIAENAGGLVKGFHENGTLWNDYLPLPAETMSGTGFYRIDALDARQNHPIMRNYYGVSYYWSMINSNVAQWLGEIENLYARMNYMVRNLDRSTIVNTFLSVRYAVTIGDSKIPYLPWGYTPVNEKDELNMTAYRNQQELPLGFTYSKVLPNTEYQALNPIQKQEAMLQAVVLPNADMDAESDIEDVNFNSRQLVVNVTNKKDIEWENGILNVKKANASLVMEFEGLRDSETYARFVGLDSDDVATCIVGVEGKFKKSMTAHFWRNNYYTGFRDIAVN
ncbi:MAG: YfhO family protein, partial [Clostridiales bacterium]|nr:YfhO family protein [Clostridiales bacterium]